MVETCSASLPGSLHGNMWCDIASIARSQARANERTPSVTLLGNTVHHNSITEAFSFLFGVATANCGRHCIFGSI